MNAVVIIEADNSGHITKVVPPDNYSIEDAGELLNSAFIFLQLQHEKSQQPLNKAKEILQIETQYSRVVEFMKKYKCLRTEQIKIIGMRMGISAAEVYVRTMKTNKLVVGARMQEDQTKTWVLKEIYDTWIPEFQKDFLAGEAKAALKVYFNDLPYGGKI